MRLIAPIPQDVRLSTDMTKTLEDQLMGRGILLWLLGVPIPIIILLALLWH